jgi:hypothetical protein
MKTTELEIYVNANGTISLAQDDRDIIVDVTPDMIPLILQGLNDAAQEIEATEIEVL